MPEHQRAESITFEISLTSVSDCGAQDLMPVLALHQLFCALYSLNFIPSLIANFPNSDQTLSQGLTSDSLTVEAE